MVNENDTKFECIWEVNLPKESSKLKYRKVASTNASRFVTHLVYMHTSVIQVRTDQGLVVKIRCPMRS